MAIMGLARLVHNFIVILGGMLNCWKNLSMGWVGVWWGWCVVMIDSLQLHLVM